MIGRDLLSMLRGAVYAVLTGCLNRLFAQTKNKTKMPNSHVHIESTKQQQALNFCHACL